MTRYLLTAVTALAVFGFVTIFGAALLPGPLAYGANILGLACGYLAARSVWRQNGTYASAGLGRAALRGALILGTIGFIGGFFGPMLFAPEANQGPMLGLFITGPGGAVLGAVGGGVRWVMQQKGRPEPS